MSLGHLAVSAYKETHAHTHTHTHTDNDEVMLEGQRSQLSKLPTTKAGTVRAKK